MLILSGAQDNVNKMLENNDKLQVTRLLLCPPSVAAFPPHVTLLLCPQQDLDTKADSLRNEGERPPRLSCAVFVMRRVCHALMPSPAHSFKKNATNLKKAMCWQVPPPPTPSSTS